MPKTKMLSCDFDKLNKEFQFKQITHNDAAEKMGFSRNYFNKCAREKSISLQVARGLESMFGIKPEQYEVKQQKQYTTNDSLFAVGDFVHHKTLGYGFVVDVDGESPNDTVKLRFKDGSERRFSVLRAPIEHAEYTSKLVAVDIDVLTSAIIRAVDAAIRIC